MKKIVPKHYDAHVLVCHGSKCSKRGASDVKSSLQKTLKAEGYHVRMSKTTCQGFCKQGCVVALEGKRPKWWGEIAPSDVSEVAAKIRKKIDKKLLKQAS